MKPRSPVLANKIPNVADQCAFYKMRRASRVVTQVYDRFLKPCDLAPTQFSLLVALASAGQVTISRLAETMAMDRTTLTRNLKPLEREGLIKIVPGPDRRTRAVTLTSSGKKKLQAALPLWEQAQTYMAKKLGQGQWEELKSTLDTTIGHLKLV